MIYTACPHCRQTLQVAPRFSGQTLSCPKCHGRFVAPCEASATGEPKEKGDGQAETAVTVLVAIVGGHIAATILLALAIGPLAAVTVVFLAAAAELALWQRSTGRGFSWMLGKTRAKLGGSAAGSPRPPSPLPQMPPAPISRDSPPPKEIQVHRPLDPPVPWLESSVVNWPSRGSGEPIPPPPPGYVPQRAEKHRSLNLQGAQLPSSGVYFFGRATRLDLGRGSVSSPLVYASGTAQHGSFDASLIDGTLPLAAIFPAPLIGLSAAAISGSGSRA